MVDERFWESVCLEFLRDELWLEEVDRLEKPGGYRECAPHVVEVERAALEREAEGED